MSETKLTVQQRVAMRLVSGLDDVTIRAIYEPRPGRAVREASLNRAVSAARELGFPLPPSAEEPSR